MMSNYSILQQNTLYGLSEPAQILYLRLCDQFRDEKKAFLEACKFDADFGAVLDNTLDNYHDVCGLKSPNNWAKVKADLSEFCSERWRNNFMQKGA